jgi:hypothetical protein
MALIYDFQRIEAGRAAKDFIRLTECADRVQTTSCRFWGAFMRIPALLELSALVYVWGVYVLIYGEAQYSVSIHGKASVWVYNGSRSLPRNEA